MAAFRVMTWNVENLFDVGDDAGPETQAQLNAKLDSLESRASMSLHRHHGRHNRETTRG